MSWKIDDGRPIWTQLKEQMIKRIVSGIYSSGEKLPRGESQYDATSIISP